MSGTSASRAIQRASGWPYQKCLQWWRAHCTELPQGPGTRSERAVALWQQKETEYVIKPGAVAFPIGNTSFVAQEVTPIPKMKDPPIVLTRLQHNLLYDLAQSPRGGEYVKTNYNPCKRLAELGFIEHGERDASWWRITEAGKKYLVSPDNNQRKYNPKLPPWAE